MGGGEGGGKRAAIEPISLQHSVSHSDILILFEESRLLLKTDLCKHLKTDLITVNL